MIKKEDGRSFYIHIGKRIADFLLVIIGLLLFWWLFLVVAVLVRIKLGSPVIFKQPRPGKDERIFCLYKFRTMTDECDNEGNLLPDEVRLTPFGKALRATSLDELPELFNILKGDMALVGPRPQLVRDMVFMTSQQRRRHSVRPGLTGLAQTNGRNAISWDEKLEYDVKYLDRISLVGDARIIWMTVGKVFKSDGISSEGMETAEDLGDYLLRLGRVSPEQYEYLQAVANEALGGTHS